MKKEDIGIEIKDGFLYISGEFKPGNEEINDENYILRERIPGKFSRTFNLPSYVDPNKITAKFEKGVLEIILGKSDSVKPKRIMID